MRYLKIGGALVLAVLALTALVGAGSASATVLCNNNTSTEACSGTYGKVKIGMKLVKNGLFVIAWESGTVMTECAISSTKDVITEPGGAKLRVAFPVELAGYTYKECSRPTEPITGGTYEIEYIDKTDNGRLLVSEFQVRVETIFGPCTWISGKEAEVGTIVGGTPATVVFNNVPLTKKSGGPLCGNVVMRGTYELTEPKPLYVAKE